MTTLPTWTRVAADSKDYSECDDPQQVAFDSWARAGVGFPVSEFDVWILRLVASNDDHASHLLKRRRQAFDAYLRDDLEVADLVYECLSRARRVRGFIPFVNSGLKVRAPFRQANTQRRTDSDAQREDWQVRANAKWDQPQHADKSKLRIAELIARDGENPDTIRRKIKKLA